MKVISSTGIEHELSKTMFKRLSLMCPGQYRVVDDGSNVSNIDEERYLRLVEKDNLTNKEKRELDKLQAKKDASDVIASAHEVQ